MMNAITRLNSALGQLRVEVDELRAEGQNLRACRLMDALRDITTSLQKDDGTRRIAIPGERPQGGKRGIEDILHALRRGDPISVQQYEVLAAYINMLENQKL